MFSLLVVEDDKNTRRLMQAILSANGYHVHLATNGIEALAIMDTLHIDLLILDIMMPTMDGYELTQVLRDSNYTLPILMISAKVLPADKRKGFIVGTDDYMTKPVDEEEMLLRIQALLRRAKIMNEHRLTIGEVTFDYDALTVSRNEESMLLPQKEFLLLYKLLSYPDKIFTRIQLMDEIWGMDTETSDSTVTVHINRLRKRFEHYPEFEIETIRGLGYKVNKYV